MDKSGGGNNVHIPNPPSFPREYTQGTNTYLGQLPQYLGSEMQYRQDSNMGDPGRIQWQQYLQNTYGPTQYGQQLSALGQIDPVGSSLRTQTGHEISNELAGNMSAGDTDMVRRAEAARGNVYGQAPVTGEAMNLHRIAMQDAMNFQNSATPEQWMSMINPVTADRSMAYVNPNAGFLGVNAINAQYQNMLARAASQMQPSSGNSWQSELSQAAMIAAMFASDRRLKENIVYTGDATKDGIPYVIFNYKGRKERMKGVVAQDVLKVRPDAVVTLGSMLGVDYGAIGATLESV